MESVVTEPKMDWRINLASQLSSKRGSLVLKGKRRVSYDLAKRISEKIGVPVDDVMAPPLAPEGSQ
jgi:hypothetical protein